MTAVVLLVLASARDEVARGNAAFEERDYEEAVNRYAAAKSEDDSSLEIDYDLAAAYYKKDEFAKAEDKFSAASRSADEKLAARAFLGLGNALIRQGKLKDAVSAYRSALDLDEDDDRARFNYELASRLLEQVEKYAEELKKKLEELMKKLAELAKETAKLASTQAGVLRDNWKTGPASKGPVLTEDEAKEIVQKVKKGEEVGPELEDKAARLAAERSGGQGETVEPAKLAAREEDTAGRSGGLAEKAARLAAEFREAFKGAQAQIPYPDKLERAGARLRSAEEKALDAAGLLGADNTDTAGILDAAEPIETRAMADILAALRELIQPPQPQQQQQQAGAEDQQEKKEEKRSEVSRAEAERWLEELKQEERKLRKDARERLSPDKLVDVEKDW